MLRGWVDRANRMIQGRGVIIGVRPGESPATGPSNEDNLAALAGSD